MHWLWFLIIGAVAGLLAGKLDARSRIWSDRKPRGRNPLSASGFLSRLLGVVDFGLICSLVTILGAIDRAPLAHPSPEAIETRGLM
jgi:hypothetical protein